MGKQENILEPFIFTVADVKNFLGIVTELGDSSLLLLITLFISLWLAGAHYYRAATGMWLSLIISGAIIALAKLFFLGCYEDTIWGIHSPSGHAALSLAVYGMIARVLNQSWDGVGKAFVNIIAVLLIVTISISRYTLGYHTIAEILIGLVAGFIGLGIASKYMFSWKQELVRVNVPVLLVAMGGIAYFVHGIHLPAEQMVKYIAKQMRSHIEMCARPSEPTGHHITR